MKKTEEKGITLIALIITIIVMLILVGVTVTVALNGGLFTTTKQAADRTTEEKEKEIIGSAYVEYIAKTYSEMKKPEDFDMLETYFLGEAKTGLDINSLIDEGKSTDEIKFFKNIEISITKNDLEYSDSGFIYVHFKYNNNMYKLTVNDNGAMTQKLEVMPKLQVQDAVVQDELDGWNITFNTTGNTYDLLEDGTITNKWWKLTNEEESQLYNDGQSGTLEVANNGSYMVMISTGSTQVEQGNNVLAIYSTENEEWWMLLLNDAGIEYIKSNKDVEVEKYKWYHFTGYQGDLNGWEEYNGNSPIVLNDFTDEQIYCRSYLERIINSFNK